MSKQLLDDLMERAGGLSPKEKQSLATFLVEQAQRDNGEDEESNAAENSLSGNGTALNAAERHSQNRALHMAWLKGHRDEYSGQYVALDGDQLKGNGLTIKEATERARANGCERPFLVYVLSNDVIADGGL